MMGTILLAISVGLLIAGILAIIDAGYWRHRAQSAEDRYRALASSIIGTSLD
jgi:hypothetical protein